MQISTMLRQDSESKAKWKLGLKKLRRQSTVTSDLSTGELGSPSLMEEDTSEAEMQDYFAKLKKKTGLNQLWSGRRFEQAIDKDPDIDQFEEPRLRASTLKELTLDSDEEDLHNFIRNLSDEENNTIQSENEDLSQTASSKSELDLMKNLNFTELGPSAYQMPEIETDDDKDYIPLIVRPNYEDGSKKHDNDDSSGNSRSNLFKNTNINFVESEVSSLDVLNNTNKNNKIKPSVLANEETVSEMSEEIPEVNDASRVNTPATLVKSHDYTASKFESYSSEESSMAQSKMSSVIEKDSRKRLEKNAKRESRAKSYRSSNSSKSSGSQSSKQGKVRSRKTRSKNVSENDISTESSTGSISSRNSKSSSSSKSESTTSVSTTTSSSEYSKKKVKPKKIHDKRVNYKQTDNMKIGLHDLRIPNEAMFLGNLATEYIDPSPIATTVVSDEALDAVTSYNPTILALNDLLKYQLQLTRQHIDNSWRLYRAYAQPDAVGTHKYTTLKQTMKYMKKHAPSVVSYKEALKQIQEGENL